MATLRKSGARSKASPWDKLPEGATVLIDTAPWIYLLQNHPIFAARFEGLFIAAEEGRLQLALSTITLAEVLTGPYKAGEMALAKRYEKALSNYQVMPLSAGVASLAAQLATALDMGAAALVTHDRDFSAVQGIPILYGD